eukprot:TRINITY_DN1796_c0_g1_i10.p1 TRINITY_DN1796_c0_g1~~TRINITY_DN1796_c0_g1_i10.p1  ORF type:complete len:448 (-),score=115.52 TRINITY_DN1796_c0_g1_i10:217-1560(-)
MGNSLDPVMCDLNPASCPSVGSCCNGYSCCSTCCSTCTSCSTSCSGSGSQRTCRQSCSNYPCNCYCCLSVSNLKCYASCPRCYKVIREVDYSDKSNIPRHATLVEDFGKNQGAAINAYNQYPFNTTLPCWYDPDDYNSVVFQRGYAWWKWFLTSFPSATLLLFLCAGTYVLFQSCFREEHAGVAQFILWVGVLFPLVFFLPLWKLAQIDRAGKIACSVLMTTFIALGWMPIVVMVTPSSKSIVAPSIIYTTLFIIPIAILLPIQLWAPNVNSLVGPIVVMPIVGVLALWIWRRRASAPASPHLLAEPHPGYNSNSVPPVMKPKQVEEPAYVPPALVAPQPASAPPPEPEYAPNNFYGGPVAVAPAPSYGQVAPQPIGYGQPQPMGYGQPQPMGYGQPQPMGYGQLQPQMGYVQPLQPGVVPPPSYDAAVGYPAPQQQNYGAAPPPAY